VSIITHNGHREGKAEEEALRQTMARLAAEGITAVNACSAASYGLEENIEAYRSLVARGALPLRVRLYSDEDIKGWEKSGDGDEWLSYGGRKFFLDGSLGGRTAAVSFPYVDEPSTRGMLNLDDETIRQKLAETHKKGIQAQIHAIGDAATDQFIGALESLENLPPLPGGLRHRLLHAQICRPDQLDRLAALGAFCDIQPVFVPSDIHIKRTSPERSILKTTDPRAACNLTRLSWKVSGGVFATGLKSASLMISPGIRPELEVKEPSSTDETKSPLGCCSKTISSAHAGDGESDTTKRKAAKTKSRCHLAVLF